MKQSNPSAYQIFYKGLQPYVPEASLHLVSNWLTEHEVYLKIARKRTSKYGDYRSPHNGHGHRISVNGNLNKYAFLEVLVHELAHLKNFVDNGRRVKPHGPEWKRHYRYLMKQLVARNIFPEDLQVAIRQHLVNPSASGCVDTELFRAFKKYDEPENAPDGLEISLLENVEEGNRFLLENGRLFEKGPKLRKRYKCLEIKTGRWFRVSPVAEVYIKKQDNCL